MSKIKKKVATIIALLMAITFALPANIMAQEGREPNRGGTLFELPPQDEFSLADPLYKQAINMLELQLNTPGLELDSDQRSARFGIVPVGSFWLEASHEMFLNPPTSGLPIYTNGRLSPREANNLIPNAPNTLITFRPEGTIESETTAQAGSSLSFWGLISIEGLVGQYTNAHITTQLTIENNTSNQTSINQQNNILNQPTQTLQIAQNEQANQLTITLNILANGRIIGSDSVLVNITGQQEPEPEERYIPEFTPGRTTWEHITPSVLRPGQYFTNDRLHLVTNEENERYLTRAEIAVAAESMGGTVIRISRSNISVEIQVEPSTEAELIEMGHLIANSFPHIFYTGPSQQGELAATRFIGYRLPDPMPAREPTGSGIAGTMDTENPTNGPFTPPGGTGHGAYFRTNDPFWHTNNRGWGLIATDFPRAWYYFGEEERSNVVIGIVDTGTAGNHQDLLIIDNREEYL